jgi:hypothetical protein
MSMDWKETLKEGEITILHQLKARGTVELEDETQIKFWERMHDMGFARITDSAVVSFEKVRGKFVQISDAGEAYLRLIA